MHRLFLIFFISMFVVIGCDSKVSSEIEEDDNKSLNITHDETKEVSPETMSENERLKEIIHNYEQALRILEEETDVVREQLNLFSLDKIKKGDQIGDLIVTNMEIEIIDELKNQYVSFEGTFEVTGKLVLNQEGSGWKYFFIVDEDLRSIPHSYHNLEEGKLIITITNEVHLEEALGEKIGVIDENGQLKISALFKNYNFIYGENIDLISNVIFHALMFVHDY